MKKFAAADWVAVGVIIGIGLLANADSSFALDLGTVYGTAKGAITGIYGALFTIAAGIIGIVEYFMSGKNIGILFGCIVVGVAPHILIAFIEILFPSVVGIATQAVGVGSGH